jgi:hypothetical protein
MIVAGGTMSVNLHAVRMAEQRAKLSLVSTLNSALLIYLTLLLLIIVGIFLSRV